MSCNPIEILPNDPEIVQLRKDLFQARYEASFYKSHYQNGIAIRERMRYEHDVVIRNLKQKHKDEIERLENQIKHLQAKVKLRERQLFGKKSEQGAANNESLKKNKPKLNRGQQAGKKTPSKRNYSHLQVEPEVRDVPENERLCPCCQAPYADMGTTEDSDLLEVEVQAHIRRIKRKKYRRTCSCPSQPVILTAPLPPKVLSKSHLGNSVWIHLLMQKFWHGQPLQRILQELESHGLSIPMGTVIGGFARLLILFRTVYQKIVEKSLTDKHWHADETGWKVFEALEGKANNRWFLWVFRSKSAAVFVLDPSRSSRVVEEFFGKDSKGFISCDRYRAYFCFVSKYGERFLIAYCWVHVRRDFLACAKDWPLYESWAMEWVQEIRTLYHLNDLRLLKPKDSKAFHLCQKTLEEAVTTFKQKADKQLKDEKLPEPCRKALESLDRHWAGLTTFVQHSEVPMDNNTAERALRGGAVGRKNYYGSGSVESAEFTAIMFTLIQTLLIWEINPQTWFDSFFDSIGSNWKKPIDPWLPWNMSAERKAEFALKKRHDPPC